VQADIARAPVAEFAAQVGAERPANPRAGGFRWLKFRHASVTSDVIRRVLNAWGRADTSLHLYSAPTLFYSAAHRREKTRLSPEAEGQE
jgi:hypothetical protein